MKNEDKKERKIIPFFKMDGLVHHSDYMKICGVEHSSSTTNLEYVTCEKCWELINNKKKGGVSMK